MSGATVRILLVEDEDAHAELIRRAFEAFPRRVDLHQARSLEDARSEMSRRPPDLVISDLRLPDGDGIELLPEEKGISTYPVVIMTSHGDEQVAVDAIKTGALDYVVKSEITLAQMPYIAERALREWSHVVERQRAEERLRESEEHFRSLIEHAHDLTAIVDEDARLVYASPSVSRTLGFRAEELAGKRVVDLIHEEDRARSESHLAQALTDPSSATRFVSRLRTSSGQWRVVETLISGHRDRDGAMRLILNGRDITDRKQAEDAKDQLEAQLRQSRRLETLGTLAGGIAHDFNNILQAILGCVELARGKMGAEDATHSYLERVNDAAQRGKDLVRQILTFSRRGEQERSLVSVQQVLDEALKLLRATFPASIEIRQESAAGDATILGDATQIHQVLMNLCTNAYHAMPEGGVLDVGLRHITVAEGDRRAHPGLEPGRFVELTVEDTGHGMSTETLERVFEPFFTTKQVGTGTGLGLSVAHGIVKSHGGEITASSEVGAGTTFAVYLPAVEQNLGEEDTGDMPAVPSPQRILFVDDEETVGFVGRGLLENMGHEVSVKLGSPEALETVRARPADFDIVITDHMMPRMTGLQLARELRQIRPDLPIIIATGASDTHNLTDALEMGLEVLGKPFRATDLAHAIQRALGR